MMIDDHVQLQLVQLPCHTNPKGLPDFRIHPLSPTSALDALPQPFFSYFQAQMAASGLLIPFLLLSLRAVSFAADDEHLIVFKSKLNNPSALDSTWIKGTDPCDRKKQWLGVDCSDSGFTGVSGLFLMNLGLSGDSASIDVQSLENLPQLRAISLENNSFSGPMPGFNRLSKLKGFFLSGNQFSGVIPPDFFEKMGGLKKIELSRNKFSGLIPASVEKLESLMSLFLENNEFSGPVPDLNQKSLQAIDFSNNKLLGLIPQSMSRFNAAAFEGNPDLCGPIVQRECTANAAAVADELKDSGTSAKWAIIGVVSILLMVTIFIKVRKKENKFQVLGKETLDEEVPMHTPISSMRSLSSGRKGRNAGGSSGHSSSRRDSQSGKSNDLVMINHDRGIFGLPDLMKASAEVLGNGGMGSSYKAVLMTGLSVVVKRLREMNKFTRDEFDDEVRILGRIKHPNILPALAYHYRKEEKLIVSEFVPNGSLLYLLHGNQPNRLNWETRLKIIKGVAQGMATLHSELSSYELPHGNLKSSNILISSNYDALLTDYALHTFINNTQLVQALFAYKCPEAVLYQQISPKSDVYCLGVVILETMTGKAPSQYLNSSKGGIDVVQWVGQAISEGRIRELIDPDIAGSASASSSLDQMEKMMYIAAACTENDVEKRIEMREAVRNIEEVQA